MTLLSMSLRGQIEPRFFPMSVAFVSVHPVVAHVGSPWRTAKTSDVIRAYRTHSPAGFRPSGNNQPLKAYIR
jgi:hypothetical protein